MIEVALVVGVALMVCVGIGCLSRFALRLSARRTLRYQLSVIAVAPALATSMIVAASEPAKLLTPRHGEAVLVALGTSLGLALVLSRWWAHQLVTAVRSVGTNADRLIREAAVAPHDSFSPASSTGSALASQGESEPTPRLPAELAVISTVVADGRCTLAELRSKARVAEEARRELVRFLYHDLRTPLAGLRALSEALEDGFIADVPQAMSYIGDTVSRMTRLVDDLLTLSRLDGPPQAKQHHLVSLTEVITEVAAELTASASRQRVILMLDTPADDRLAVWGTPDDLTRALTNLVINAIRHTDPGLTVRLVAQRAEDGRIRISVIDSCGGIDDAHLPLVFDTGWRGLPASRGGDGGAGLGLAIARNVVELHAGQIAVQNVDGGCRFQIHLPSSMTGTPPGWAQPAALPLPG